MREDDNARESLPGAEGRAHETRGSLRPRHCWEIVRQIPGLHFNCEECYAYFVQQDCWTLWALRRPGFKPCCQKKGDCADCAILVERLRPANDERIEIDRRRPMRPSPAAVKRICNYLQLFDGGTLVEGEIRGQLVAKALQMRNADFRCRLRGVHLDMGYVNDVCVSRQVEECVFLGEARPQVQVRPLPMLKGVPPRSVEKQPVAKGDPGETVTPEPPPEPLPAASADVPAGHDR